MRRTTILLSASLAAASLVLTACSDDTPSPTETVRLAVIGDNGGRPFLTHMTQEVTSTPVWSGDPDGSGTALITVNRGIRTVCWKLTVANITLPATAAHIHEADVGIRGGIVVTLSAPGTTGYVTGCVSDVDSDLLSDILQNPESYYVNVHTTDYGAGAIRGQMGH